MKQKPRQVFKDFILWMRRYWGLVFILFVFMTPILFFLAIGVPLNEAIYAASWLLHPIGGGRGLDFSPPQYHPSEAIVIVVIILVILAFIVYSIARYALRSKR